MNYYSSPRRGRRVITGLLLAALVAPFSGCLSVPTKDQVAATVAKARPYVRPAATLVATGALLAAKPDQRVTTAKYLNAVATGLRTITADHVPTVSEVDALINKFTPAGQQYEVLATSVLAIYSSVFAQAQGQPSLAFQVLTDLADGLDLAARPYLTQPATAVAVVK